MQYKFYLSSGCHDKNNISSIESHLSVSLMKAYFSQLATDICNALHGLLIKMLIITKTEMKQKFLVSKAAFST